jgi:hypothetical protein
MSLRYTRENTEPHFSRNRGIPISQLCAHGGARGQVPPKPLPFETLHKGLAIRFLGSVYATAQTAAAIHRHLPRTPRCHRSSSSSSAVIVFLSRVDFFFSAERSSLSSMI